MQRKQIETENGYIYYEIKNNKAIVTGFTGNASRILLPQRLEDCPVTAVDRKAFLSQKSLCAVTFPDSIEEIGDWAFAHCDNLAELSFSRQTVRFGRAVFKNCGRLKRIEARDTDEKRHAPASGGEAPWGFADSGRQWGGDAAPELLAATVTMLDAYYLLDLQAAGSPEWLGKWDTKLLSVLRTPDQEGYISQSVYGEEDYIGTDLEEYTSERRREKVRLAYLRLLHPQALQSTLKQELEDYLRSLTKGQPNEETWQVLLREHSGDLAYYSLFAELACMTEDNFDAILVDIGEEAPEMKAFFLKYRGEQRGQTEDFFESLEL